MIWSGWRGMRPVCSVMAVLARWQSPATTSPPARSSSCGQLAADRQRVVGVLGPQSPHPVDPGALLDQLDAGAGQLHEVAALQADVLGPQVAGRVVGDLVRDIAAEVGVERGALALVDAHQVLARVEGAAGRRAPRPGRPRSRGSPCAARSCTSAEGPRCRGRRCRAEARALDVLDRRLREVVEVAAVQPRRPTAADALGERALDAVALVDLDQVLADGRVLVLDQARGEDRDPPLPLGEADAGRFLNQVVKRWRANGGSRRTLDTPVAFSITLRTSEPGLAVTALASDAMRRADLAEEVGAAEQHSSSARGAGPPRCWRDGWRRRAASSGGSRWPSSLWPGTYGQLT